MEFGKKKVTPNRCRTKEKTNEKYMLFSLCTPYTAHTGCMKAKETRATKIWTSPKMYRKFDKMVYLFTGIIPPSHLEITIRNHPEPAKTFYTWKHNL